MTGITLPVDRVLDVGCGTGQSSVALVGNARRVLGIDSSAYMLSVRRRHPAVTYCQAAAEKLPVSERAVDLVVVALAFHWLRQEPFLAEAHRVLRPTGWLIVYDAWFTGHMNDHAEFSQWFRT